MTPQQATVIELDGRMHESEIFPLARGLMGENDSEEREGVGSFDITPRTKYFYGAATNTVKLCCSAI